VVCFEKGLAVEPRKARLGRLEDAVQALQRAVGIRPAKATLQFQLALMLARGNRMPEALAAAEKGVRLAPHDANGRALLEELRAAGR
jgi:tetratricopeptide (TPR) repeat protein